MTLISDQQIAVLCDVAETPQTSFEGGRKRDLDWLIEDGYVEVEDGGARNAKALPKYKLTSKAERLLTSRGAGQNIR